jgi:hypothetical protein
MGLFKGVQNAPDYADGGSYFKDGKYLVLIDVCKQGETRENKEFAVIENTIIRSTNAEIPPGKSVSAMHMKNDSFLSNIAHFASRVMGVPKEELDEETCEGLFSEENPARGMVMRVEAKTVKTKAGGDYTKTKWSAPNGADIDLVMKEGIQIGKGKKVKVTLRDDNPFDEEEGEPFVP